MQCKNDIDRRKFLHDTLRFGVVGAGLSRLGAAAVGADESTAPADEETWQLGCFTRPWDKYDYRTALDAIAESGFKYVGIMTTNTKTWLIVSVATTIEEAHAIGEEVSKRGLKVPALYGGDIPVKESLEAGIQGLRKLIDNSAAAGSKTLMMGGVGESELYDVYYKAIAECCDYAEEKGVGLTLKPHGGLNATGPQCRKAIEQVGHRNFTLWYDPGNIYYYSDGKLDPVEQAATVDGLVTGMCVKDYRDPKDVMVTPGKGRVNFPAVFARLKQGGFTHGPLLIETLAPGNLTETIAQAKETREFLKETIART